MISKQWVKQTREYFLTFLRETHFPEFEQAGERGATVHYPEWLIMLIGVRAVKCKEKRYVGRHRLALAYWPELWGRQVHAPPTSERQLRTRLKEICVVPGSGAGDIPRVASRALAVGDQSGSARSVTRGERVRPEAGCPGLCAAGPIKTCSGSGFVRSSCDFFQDLCGSATRHLLTEMPRGLMFSPISSKVQSSKSEKTARGLGGPSPGSNHGWRLSQYLWSAA